MKGKRAIYALYLGDESVDVGTEAEIMRHTGKNARDIATKTRKGKQKTGYQAYRYFEERE